MPISHVLTTYTIIIRDAQTGGRVNLSSFDGVNDFRDVLRTYLENRAHNFQKDDILQRVFRISSTSESPRAISGFIERGSYGSPSSIIDTDTFEEAYFRRDIDADLLNFYYLFAIPENEDRGVAIFHKIGLIGFMTDLTSDLKSYFSNLYNGFNLDFRPLFPSQQIAELIDNSRLLELRFIQFGLHRLEGDRIRERVNEQDIKVKFSYEARRGKSLNQLANPIKRILRDGEDAPEVLELQPFEADQLKLVVEDNENKQKTINLFNPTQINPSTHITDDIEYDENGIPTFESIDIVAKGRGNELLQDSLNSDLHLE